MNAVEAARQALNMKPGAFAAALGLSRAHAHSIRTGRRDLSLALAVKLEVLTGRRDFVRLVVARVGKRGAT